MSDAPRAAVPPAPTETGTTAVLAGLRVALHVTFAALLTVGLARALADRSPDASGPFPATTLVLLTAALAGVYLAGTVLERRRWARGDDVGRGPAVAGRRVEGADLRITGEGGEQRVFAAAVAEHKGLHEPEAYAVALARPGPWPLRWSA